METHQEGSRIRFSRAGFLEEIELEISCSEGQFNKGFRSKAEEYISKRKQSSGRGSVEPRRVDIDAKEDSAEDLEAAKVDVEDAESCRG